MSSCCWQVRLLREELASAQEAAAAAAGHAKQYEALAASSDEAFKAMKVQHCAEMAELVHLYPFVSATLFLQAPNNI